MKALWRCTGFVIQRVEFNPLSYLHIRVWCSGNMGVLDTSVLSPILSALTKYGGCSIEVDVLACEAREAGAIPVIHPITECSEMVSRLVVTQLL